MNITFEFENTTLHCINFTSGRFSKAIPIHSHGNNCYEIHYVPEGFGRLIADGKTYDIVPETLYVTGPHVSHAQFPLHENPMEEYCLYLKTGNISRKSAGAPILKTFTSTAFWFGNAVPDLLALFTELKKESQKKEFGYLEKTKALLCQIIVEIVRNYRKKENTSIPHTEILFSDNKSLIIEEYFLYEYADLSLKELAERLHLSTRQTERILMEYYGQTFRQKKLEARMSIAAILLREDKSISSIADALGFSSLEHFSNTFKKYYHMPPSGFRNSSLNL